MYLPTYVVSSQWLILQSTSQDDQNFPDTNIPNFSATIPNGKFYYNNDNNSNNLGTYTYLVYL